MSGVNLKGDVPKGWQKIIDAFVNTVTAVGWEGHAMVSSIRQGKQLHIFVSPTEEGRKKANSNPKVSQAVWDAIQTAQREAERTCSQCGEPMPCETHK